MRNTASLLTLAWAMALNSAAHGADNGAASSREKPSETVRERTSTMKIRLTINEKAITATLIDNATVRDFLTLLPMTLTLEDLRGDRKDQLSAQKTFYRGCARGQRSFRW